MKSTVVGSFPVEEGSPSNFKDKLLNSFDKEILKSAISVDAGALEFASDRLKADKEVIMTAAENDGQVLYFASEELRDDKDVVLVAVAQKPIILKYASFRLRDDKDIAIAAISKGKNKVIEYISPRLREDEDTNNTKYWFEETVKKAEEAITKLVKENGEVDFTQFGNLWKQEVEKRNWEYIQNALNGDDYDVYSSDGKTPNIDRLLSEQNQTSNYIDEVPMNHPKR